MADESILARTTSLKDEAWAVVTRTPEYKAYFALKRAVAAMEGTPEPATLRSIANPPVRRRMVFGGPGRVSQAEAAVIALRQAAGPLTTTELLAILPSIGAVVGGENPEVNLASSLSRSEIIESVRIEGVAKWRIKTDAEPKAATDS